MVDLFQFFSYLHIFDRKLSGLQYQLLARTYLVNIDRHPFVE